MSNLDAMQRAIENWEVEIRRGVIVLLVLAALSDEDLHGMALIDKISRKTETIIEVPLGTIYPLLRRFIKENLIETYKPSGGDVRKTMYTLNNNGKEFFLRARYLWHSYTSTVNNFLDQLDENNFKGIDW